MGKLGISDAFCVREGPEGQCEDTDEDGHDAISSSCPGSDDECDGTSEAHYAHNWTLAGCLNCMDNDQDGYGDLCDKGEDCDDEDETIHEGCVADGDLDEDLEFEEEDETPCGNGSLDDGETCEQGDTVDCITLGSYFISGTASCNATCNGWNLSGCESELPEDFCDYNICFSVPPTNQTVCYDTSAIACPGEAGSESCGNTDFCGQDAQYPDNARAYTCYDANGAVQNPCDETADADEVVTDSLTGLMWQRQVPDNYPNCTVHSACTWQEALDYCSGLTYGGYDDWRLPNPHELQSIVDDGCYRPSINTTAFPGTPWYYFWSSTTYADYDSCYAWCAEFNFGSDSCYMKGENLYVRCVRGGL